MCSEVDFKYMVRRLRDWESEKDSSARATESDREVFYKDAENKK